MIRQGLLAMTATACTALLVLSGAAAATAADEGAASGLSASIVDGRLTATWTHSPQTLTDQWLRLSDVADLSGGDSLSSSVDPAAASAAVDLPIGRELTGGHTYAVSVVSVYQDGYSFRRDAISDTVDVTLPQQVPDTPEDEPTCTIRDSARSLTVGVPATAAEDTSGTHTITGRAIEILQNGKPYATRTIAGAAPGSVTLTVPYLRATASTSSTRYTARWSIVTPAGPSRPSDACTALLSTPRPHDFAMRGTLRHGVAGVTWAKATDRVSAIAKYRVSWQLGDGVPHWKTIGASGDRSFSIRVGKADRVSLQVFAYNSLNTWSANDLLWTKHRGTWFRAGGR